MASGIWVCGQFADRIGRRPVFLLFQTGALIMIFVYSRITQANMLLWVGAIMGIFVNGLNGGIGALMSEAYPTIARATAQNTPLEYWTRSWFTRTNNGRRVGGKILISCGYWFSRLDLRSRYLCNTVFDPGTQGEATRLIEKPFRCECIIHHFLSHPVGTST
jgi:hypothetical protein